MLHLRGMSRCPDQLREGNAQRCRDISQRGDAWLVPVGFPAVDGGGALAELPAQGRLREPRPLPGYLDSSSECSRHMRIMYMRVSMIVQGRRCICLV